MSDQNDEFERIAIARDLVRKPEIKFLAAVLHNLATGSVTTPPDLPAIYVTIAHKLLTKPGAKTLLIQALEVLPNA